MDNNMETSNEDWWSSIFNQTAFNEDVNELSSNLHPASDVDIEGVLTSAIFNFVVFITFMLSYEVLRRCFPNVYASRQSREVMLEGASKKRREQEEEEQRRKRQYQQQEHDVDRRDGKEDTRDHVENTQKAKDGFGSNPIATKKGDNHITENTSSKPDGLLHSSEGDLILRRIKKQKQGKTSTLPDVYGSEIPLQWISPVFRVSWRKVRDAGGLDAYFFLRYIRMCFKITSVSALWGAMILFPCYSAGQNGAVGWYHVSMANVSQGSPIIWVSITFIYFFSAFVLFVMKQEFKHFVELRLDFLGKGDTSIEPQHHYSLMVENIPKELRSNSALFSYFNKLFPGKVHSTNIILKVPELETLSQRKLRITRRLEKSLAFFEATGKRPTHIIGRFRPMICGVESTPFELCCDSRKVVDISAYYDGDEEVHVKKGLRVDSIDYYTRDLQDMNTKMFLLQKQKGEVAAFGNKSINGNGWFSALSEYAQMVFDEELSDKENEEQGENSSNDSDDSSLESLSSEVYNRRWKPSSKRCLFQQSGDRPKKEPTAYNDRDESPINNDRIMYGSVEENVDGISPARKRWFGRKKDRVVSFRRDILDTASLSSKEEPLISNTQKEESTVLATKELFIAQSLKEEKSEGLFREDGEEEKSGCGCLNTSSRSGIAKKVSKVAGRLGLDFGLYLLKLLTRRLQSSNDDNTVDVMSSTGFVTFLDLGTVTSVASTPLTHKPTTLTVKVAPEPRDILWNNCTRRADVNERREIYANITLTLGAILWSFPLAAIQALASAEQVAKIPGMEWIQDFDEGKLKVLINAYLPVVTLLAIIMILPLIFEFIAVSYEKRKTLSDVNKSIVSRYFYYQLANIYISVTAGSIWMSASQIIDRPKNGLEILGNSLPTVVGYFISLLVTKILGGLPLVILRVGALGRYLMLRLIHRTKYLTQRELDNVYCVEPLYYGWEYPTQLLVIVICFTYACISPIILFFGALYFIAALMVYKKQVLYVYTPSYESGGDLFPLVCDRTIFGLICGQLTFMGYSIVRGGHIAQVLSVLPLILFTLSTMSYFRTHFADPSQRLTLELAMELDEKIREQTDLGRTPSHSLLSPFQDNCRIPQDGFDRNYYKQPVMTEPHGEPMFYRIDRQDPMTTTVRQRLRNGRLHMWYPDRTSMQQSNQDNHHIV